MKPRIHSAPQKTTSLRRLERELREKDVDLELAQKRGFKANYVPASSLMPAYANMMHQAKLRSEANLEKRRREILKSQVPFRLEIATKKKVRAIG